jgi:type VI protein secretion system component VasK
MTFEAHETGVWGFFRMLDRGQFGGTATTPQVQIRASSGPETWILPFEFELEGQSPKHPFRKNALRFDLPPSI